MDAEPHKTILNPGDSTVNDSQNWIESNGVVEEHKIERDLQNMPCIYRQDVVRCNTSGKIGIVMEVAGDSDSDSSITDDDDDDDDNDNDDEEDDDEASENEGGEHDYGHQENDIKKNPDGTITGPLPADHVRVLWMDEHVEKDQNLPEVTVIDRGFLHGDFVASALDPTGQLGVVVDINMSVDLLAHDSLVINDVSSRDLKRVTEFTVGDYVVLGPWLGRVDDVLVNVTVLFDDGSVCKVSKADPEQLVPNLKNILEDGHFPYYPGQRVKASSSSVFKNSRWLSGLWKASRLEGTVTKVSVASVFIYWIASAGYGPDSSTAPAEEQSPKNLKLLSCFAHSNWQLGDCCLLPSAHVPSSMSSLLNENSSNHLSSDQKESDCTDLSLDFVIGVMPSDVAKNHSEPTGIDSATLLNDSTENTEFSSSLESTLYSSSVTASRDPAHEHRPLHRKKIRKIVLKREKKVRKIEVNFERALFIVNSKTRVDVAWQDGTIECGLISTSLIPIDSPGDHDFVSEQYVVEKAPDEDIDASEARRVGVVKSVSAKERTACIRWLKQVSRAEDAREFEKEEVVSVYELEGHPDYDYCYGDVVVRLSPVTVSTQEEPKQNTQQAGSEYVEQDVKSQRECAKSDDASGDEACPIFPDLSWVGNITGLKNGDIEVTWADGMVSTVGPQAIYVVGRDDDDSVAAGSEVSDAASWETLNEDEMDVLQNSKENFDASDVEVEVEEKSVSEDGYSGRNGALSISLAALGFVTRFASGILSRVRKPSDLSLDSSDALEHQARESIRSSNQNLSVDELGPNEFGDVSDSHPQSSHNTQEEHGDADADALDLLKEVNPIQNLRLEELEARDGSCDFKRFDTAKDPLDHHYIGANGQNNNGRKWLKKIQQDWSILQNNLPEGIYVRVYEDRMDLLRAVITGAYETPYQDGLFFFDFHLPPEYPDVPPSAYYHSGGWRINPNLYEEGKVCLSLLNTWTGRGNEVWDPASSSILQVLVSLQGLVLNAKPYFNEAGYDKQLGTAEGEKNSLSYNENTFLLNCKTMMYLMRKPPKDFEELVRDHFRRRGFFILRACDAYMKGHLIGSLQKDASASDTNSADSTSVGFKLMLKKLVPKLFSALKEAGADCDQFAHLLQS